MSCRPLFLVLFVLLIYIFKFSLFGSRPFHTLHRQGPGAFRTLLKHPVPSRSLRLLDFSIQVVLNQSNHEQLFAQLSKFVLLTHGQLSLHVLFTGTLKAPSTERMCERIRNARIVLPPPAPIAWSPSHRAHRCIQLCISQGLRGNGYRCLQLILNNVIKLI